MSGEGDPLTTGDISSGPSEGSLYLDGLLHGDEGKGCRYFYKAWMFAYITFSLFGVAAGPATFTQPQWTIATIPMSVAIFGILAFSLFLVKQYRVDNMSHGWRYFAFLIMICNVCLASSAALLMHKSFQPLPDGCPPTTTTTMAPTEPANETTTSHPGTYPPGPFSPTTGAVTTKPNASSSSAMLRRLVRAQQRRQQEHIGGGGGEMEP